VVKILAKLFTLSSLLILLLASQTSFALTKLTASIDSNPVMNNESIVLTVIADDSLERDALDTSPLLNNFIVARTDVSSQTSMVNFSTTRTTRWQIVLIPREKATKTGNLMIPALSVDGYQSQVINVQIIDQSNNTTKQQQEVFIETELSSKNVYVQQLLTLTVKLHIGVQLQRASLTEPALKGATIEHVGKDNETDAIINGKRYRIIERSYAITPEQSGELTLVTPMFSGDMVVQSRRRSAFSGFDETKPINILGEKLTLNVRPIPDNYPIDLNTSWLPSESLTLHQEWQPQNGEFKVGEPITRTITVTATGIAKAQFPKIIMIAPAGLKVYPDQAELHSSLTKDRLISQKRQSFALVASQAGDYVLPKVTIAWWNTVTNKYQQAELPEQIITVKPNNDLPKPTITNNQSASLTQPKLVSSAPATAPMIIETSPALQWLFLVLWLVTLIAWLIHVLYLNRSFSRTSNTVSINKKENNHYLALIAACKTNHGKQALNFVLPWLNSLHKSDVEITTLTQAFELVNNKQFTCAMNEVQQHLYGKKGDRKNGNESNDNKWQGTNLLNAVQAIQKSGINLSVQKTITLNPI